MKHGKLHLSKHHVVPVIITFSKFCPNFQPWKLHPITSQQVGGAPWHLSSHSKDIDLSDGLIPCDSFEGERGIKIWGGIIHKLSFTHNWIGKLIRMFETMKKIFSDYPRTFSACNANWSSAAFLSLANQRYQNQSKILNQIKYLYLSSPRKSNTKCHKI